MTPQEWIESTKRRWDSGHLYEGAQHLAAALEEIARLRSEVDAIRAGVAVVVPEPLDVEVEVELSKWWPVGPGWRAGFAEGVIWARSRAHSVPASRVLKDGEVAVKVEEWNVLLVLERYARKHGPESISYVIETLDALRAQEGGAR